MTDPAAPRSVGELLAQTDDGWPVAVVAGNTYGHYEEHRRDVEAPPTS